MQKIAFRLNSDKAVEYANAHRENRVIYRDTGHYFHIPQFTDVIGIAIHEDFNMHPDYEDVTENFERDYYWPWKDKLASVQNREVNVVATLGSGSSNTDGHWISVKDRLPEEGQIVDIWEMPTKQTYDRAVSLVGTEYGNQYYDETYYSGWRSTNYKYKKESDGEGEINVFVKCNPRFLNVSDGYEHRKICVENGEVTHWMPLPQKPPIEPNDERTASQQTMPNEQEAGLKTTNP